MLSGKIATKHDIDRLNARIDQLGSDLRGEMNRLHADILKWMFTQAFVILAGGGVLVHFLK